MPPSCSSSYTLPSYFTKHRDSPHNWGEIAYLEYLFPEGVQITSPKYRTALNRWVGAIKWLKENSEHAEQAAKLHEQHHSDQHLRKRLRNWYNRKARNGKLYKAAAKGTSIKVNRTTVIGGSTVNVEVEGATIHGVNHVNYGQNFINHNNSDQNKTNGSTHHQLASSGHEVTPPSASLCSSGHGVSPPPASPCYSDYEVSPPPPSSRYSDHEVSLPPASPCPPDHEPASSCRVQGAIIHDVDHVNYGQNFVDYNNNHQHKTSDVHYQPASPDREVTPPSTYYEAGSTLSSTSVVFSSTKRVLADIIHDSSLPRNHIARTGVIVLYDSKVRTLFEPSELQELIKREPPLQKLDEVFLTALKGYGSDTTPNQFRHTARTHPYRPDDEPHDDSKHAQAEWVDMVILWMLKLYAGYGDLRARTLLEGWFDTCIWSVIFDLSTFAYKWMVPRRKEVQSWSLKSIAAHTDDPIDKFNQRSLYDGIIYDETYFDHLEFAIFEVAKDFNSLNETKLVSDRRKLYRGMHGMGRLISRAVDHDPETMKCVQVIGVQNMEFSFQIQVGTLISPEEMIISQGEVQTIPTTFDKLQTILIALKSVGYAMEIMNRSEKAVEKYLNRNTVRKPNLFVEELLKSGL